MFKIKVNKALNLKEMGRQEKYFDFSEQARKYV